MEEGGFEGNQWNGALELVQLKWNGQQQRRRVLKKEIKLFHYNSSLRGVTKSCSAQTPGFFNIGDDALLGNGNVIKSLNSQTLTNCPA